MTDEPKPTPEELELAEAKRLAAITAEKVEGAEDLPRDVADGNVSPDDTVTITGDNLVVTETPEDGE